MTTSEIPPRRVAVIGLGGTGVRMLARVREQLFLAGRLQSAALTDIDWLAIADSADAPRRGDHSQTTLLGHDLQLPRADRIGLTLPPAGDAQVQDPAGASELDAAALGAFQTWLKAPREAGPPRAVHLLVELGCRAGLLALPQVIEALQPLRAQADWTVRLHAVATAAANTTDAADAAGSPPHAAIALQALLGEGVDQTFVNEAEDAADRLADWVTLQIRRGPGAAPEAGVFGVGLHRVGTDLPGRLEHLTHEMAQRMLWQLRHDHWRAHLGFVDHPSATDASDVASPEQLQRWRLRDGDLWMLPGQNAEAATAAADSVVAQWQEYEAHFRSLVAAVPPEQRLARWRALFEAAWSGGWNGVGVEQHFAALDDDLFRLADHCALQVEADLLQDWQAGRRSLHACGRFVAALMADLAQRGEQAESQAEPQRRLAAEADQRLGEVEARLAEQATARGGLAGMIGLRPGAQAQRDQELAQASALLRERAVALTQAAALAFAARYARALGSRLSDLIGLIDAVELALGSLASEFEAASLAQLPARQSDHPLDARQRVDALRQRLLSDEPSQREQARRARALWFDILGKRANFRTFALELGEDHLRHPLLALCAAAMQQALDQEPPTPLWDALAQRWESESTASLPVLEHWIHEARRGVPDPDSATWCLALPQLGSLQPTAVEGNAAAPSEVERTLAQALGLAADALPRLPAPSALGSTDCAALICLSAQAPLAERAWVKRLLSTAPDASPDAPPDVTRDAATTARALNATAPSADAPDPVAQARRLLLLGAALGLLQERPATATEPAQCLLLRRDADGFDLERSVIGSGLIELAAHMAPALLARLHAALFETDLDAQVHRPERHGPLRDALRARIEALCSSAAPAEVDALSLAWSDAARAVMRFARKEASL